MLHNNKNVTNPYIIWCLFLIVVIFEFYLFHYYVSHNISPFYPGSFDQASYLPVSYHTYESIHQHGFIAGLLNTKLLATGLLFPIQAAISYALFGASRFAALLPNFFYFILLQLFTLIAIKKISSQKFMPLIFLGLLLSIQTPFLNAGGLMDFRIDFMAFCLYGIILCSVINSQLFLDKKWSLITALFATLLILLRCITIVYLLAIFSLMTLYLFFYVKTSSTNTNAYAFYKERLVNLFCITAFIGALGIIYIWVNHDALYNYYIIGHVLGVEKDIRAHEVGVVDFISLLSYYPNSLLMYHIDTLAIYAGIITLLIFILNAKLSSATSQHSAKNPIWKTGFVFIIFSLVIPLIVLTTDINKSPVVGSIMVMPLLWLMIWLYLSINKKIQHNRFTTYTFNVLAICIFTLGVWNQFHQLHYHKSKTQINNLSRISQMYLDIGDYAKSHNWSHIDLSIDQVCDYITSGGIETLYYEFRHQLIPVNIERMGGVIFSITKNEALTSMKKSNIIIFNINPYSNKSPYPFNDSIHPIKQELLNYANTHFARLNDYEFMNSTYRVFINTNWRDTVTTQTQTRIQNNTHGNKNV